MSEGIGTYSKGLDQFYKDLGKSTKSFQASDVMKNLNDPYSYSNYSQRYAPTNELSKYSIPSNTGNQNQVSSVFSNGYNQPTNLQPANSQLALNSNLSTNNNNAIGSPSLERWRGTQADIAEKEFNSMDDFDWGGAANLGMGIGNFGMGISSFLDNRKYNQEALGALQDNRQYARESNDRLNNFTNKTISAFATS